MGRVRAQRSAAAVLLLVVGVGCSGAGAEPESDTEPPGATSSAADPGSSSSTAPEDETSEPEQTTPVVDGEHTVEPPGPLKDRLYYADVLIFDEDPLSEDTVERIQELDGVEAVESIGLAQVVLENQALNVAAVDPATYRRFTPQTSAELQEAWERVAGGEAAVTPALGKRLEDGQGELTLGSQEDAPQVHIGAYAPQAEQVDAVVNEKWAEELGMELGNALLVNTGIRSPDSLRKPIQRITGDNASIQNLDAVARYGLDTSVQQTAVPTGGSVADVIGTFNYTVLGGGRIAPEQSWVRANIETRVMPIIGEMTCHKAMFPQLESALREVVESDLADELHPDEYAGCYYPRFIAGTNTLSNHSFGTAMDFNTSGNQRGTVGEMHRGIVTIFKKWGFAWGGDWSYTDPMHFEMNAVVTPG